MKKKFNKQQVMKNYYSDEELKNMMKMPVAKTLQWLESARRFLNKVTPLETKKLQKKLALEGW